MIEEIINKHLIEQQEKTLKERRTDKFNVSMSGSCFRKRTLIRLLGQQEITDERLLRVFQVGHLFHEWIQDLLAKEGRLYKAEERLESNHFIGHYDGLVWVDEEKTQLALIDIKTVHSRKFNYLKSEPDKHYQKQLATYYLLLKLLEPETASKIVDIINIYVSKDDLRIKELSLPNIKEVLERYKNASLMEILADTEKNIITETADENIGLVQIWKSQKLPDAKPFEEWECKYCPFRFICEKLEKGLSFDEVKERAKEFDNIRIKED